MRRVVVATTLAGPSAVAGHLLAQAPISTAWPAPTVDVGTYATVFECLSASNRVAMTAPERMILRDTLPNDGEDVRAPFPAAVIDIAQRCSARSLADSVSVTEFTEWMTLFLQAGRDADATTLRDRWLAMRTASDSTTLGRIGTLQTLLSLYIEARPVRMESVVALVTEIQRLDVAWDQRFHPAFDLFTAARAINDSVLARRAATWVVDIVDHLQDTEREEPRYINQQNNFLSALRYLTGSDALDSLRKSTEAYLALQHSLGRRIQMSQTMLGTTARSLEGDFWFPSKPEVVPPVAGRVSLVVMGASVGRLGGSAVLRRLRQRFPDLDIVLSASTSGYFGGTTPPAPAEEAEFFRRWFHEFYPVVSTLVVETTPFWRLPDPDRRRINEGTVNNTNYPGAMWLIDQTQTIIYGNVLSKNTEQEYAALIEVLLSR